MVADKITVQCLLNILVYVYSYKYIPYCILYACIRIENRMHMLTHVCMHKIDTCSVLTESYSTVRTHTRTYSTVVLEPCTLYSTCTVHGVNYNTTVHIAVH